MSKKLLSICMTAAFTSILTANMYVPQKLHNAIPIQAKTTVTHHTNNSNEPSLENANELKTSLEENSNENETILTHHIHKLL